MPFRWSRARYPIAAALCTATGVVALPLRPWLDQANIAMLFLLAVFLIALRLGRGPAVLGAFLCVAFFDVFFVPPHLSFSVADAQYLVTFAVMLSVGLITTHLTARLAERQAAAQISESETRLLYGLARDLGSALTVDQVAETVGRFLGGMGMSAALAIDRSTGGEADFLLHGTLGTDAMACMHDAYRNNAPVMDDRRAAGMMFLPFSGATRVRGVLAVERARTGWLPLLDTVASLAGIAIERLHYAEVAGRSELDVESEKLRSSLLSSISHDLRTPLTSLVGLADTLAERGSSLPDDVGETAAIIRDQAHAMHRMVSNLLDMARLQSGRVALNRQWQPFEEIVGSSVRLLDDSLTNRRLAIDLPDDLPLVNFDAVLMERVLCNLLENAVKYSLPDAAIALAARVAGEVLEVSVCNAGAGFPPERLDRVFDLFARGQHEPAVPGTGIGLAICRAIVAAHGGTIVAENRSGQACVRFSLPLGTPPDVSVELS